MPTHAYPTVLGATYRFNHEQELDLGTYSEGIYTWAGESIWLHACTAESCMATLLDVFATEFVEDMRLGSGRLLLGQYESRDERLGITLAVNSVALWTDETAAMWADTGQRGIDWTADFMSDLQPASIERAAYAQNVEPRNIQVEHAEMHVTVFSSDPSERELPPSRLFALHAPESMSQPSKSGRPTRAGEMFVKSRGAGRPRQVILRSESAIATVSEERFGPQQAVAFLEGFLELTREPTT